MPPFRVVIRLVGGPADGQVFVVPQLPKFFGVGCPVSRYEREAVDGDVRIFRHATVSE